MSVPNSASSPYARNLNVVKMYFKKPMALIISILSLVVLVMNFVLSSSSHKLAESMTETLSQLSESGADMTITSGSSNGILGYLFSGIVIVCFFMIYFFSASPGGSPFPFFKTLHILSVIELILTALGSLIIVIMGLVSILSIDTVVKYMVENVSGFESINVDELERNVTSFKPTLFLILGITVVILAIVLVYINAQTAFLKSCTRSCREPSLFTKGAKTYGNLSIVMALLQLVLIVMVYFTLKDAETVANTGLNMNLDLNSIMMPFLVYYLLTAVTTFLKGTFAKGWEPFAKENEDYVYSAASAASRSPEANPIATYKSTTRRSNEAVKQSQPYLYGEEPNNDPNKKSSYIPEELQNDYPPQYDQQQGMMGGDPFMGDPFANPMQPMGGDPYASDPFAQSPMGNPYGQPPMDPNSQNPYNNGFM